jgi:hypothetical protein
MDYIARAHTRQLCRSHRGAPDGHCVVADLPGWVEHLSLRWQLNGMISAIDMDASFHLTPGL